MSKKYKVKRKSDPRKELKKGIKKVNWKKLFGIFGITVLIFSVYEVALILEFGYIIHIYAILAGILALVFGIMNRGFARFDPETVSFPEEYTEEQRAKSLETEYKRRKRAKLFLVPLIGILITLAIDTVYLFYIEPIIR